MPAFIAYTTRATDLEQTSNKHSWYRLKAQASSRESHIRLCCVLHQSYPDRTRYNIDWNTLVCRCVTDGDVHQYVLHRLSDCLQTYWRINLRRRTSFLVHRESCWCHASRARMESYSISSTRDFSLTIACRGSREHGPPRNNAPSPSFSLGIVVCLKGDSRGRDLVIIACSFWSASWRIIVQKCQELELYL